MTELADWEQEALAKLHNEAAEYELIPEKTALVIIDMQYLDAHPDYGYGKRARSSGSVTWSKRTSIAAPPRPGKIQDLLQTAARSASSVPRRHRAVHQRRPRVRAGLRGCWVYRPPKGSRETDILDELTPLDDEIVLPKITSSAFNSTPLDQMLRNMGKDTIIVCGVVTNGCVETTFRDGRDFGYKVVMVSDASAAMTIEGHENTSSTCQGRAGTSARPRASWLSCASASSRRAARRPSPRSPSAPDRTLFPIGWA